jgi:two-component system sensor histidine kinase SenX3
MKARARRSSGAGRVAGDGASVSTPRGPSPADRERIRRDFLAMAMCHELKQPLHSLNLNLELLTKRITKLSTQVTSPPDVDSSLSALGRVVDRVNDCLNAYAARATPDPTRPPRCDLSPLLHEAAARAAAGSLGVRVAVTVGELPHLPLHIDQIAVALDAILANAIHASELASASDVLLSARRTDDEVRVEVIDKGIGMPPEVVRHAFEIGYSTWDGDGTGLTIAKFIAYHHSGGFGLTSRPGQGTTVSLVLPIGVDED